MWFMSLVLQTMELVCGSIQFIFDTSEFYGDYAVIIEFVNDLGSDDSSKEGQSNWKWFHICNTNSDGSCSD